MLVFLDCTRNEIKKLTNIPAALQMLFSDEMNEWMNEYVNIKYVNIKYVNIKKKIKKIKKI